LKTIYLAGPITGLTFQQASHGWRQDVEAWLFKRGLLDKVQLLSPLRGKEYLADQGVLAKQYLNLHPLSSPQGIVRRDYNDVITCDAVLANFFGATKVSLGTAWEMGVAYAHQKPVVAIIEENSCHDHPFITQTASYTFEYMGDSALEALMLLIGVR